MKRLNKQERAMLRELGNEALELRYDEARRLRNALRALAELDTGWLAWLEKETPRRIPVKRERRVALVRLVEARARLLLLKRYRSIMHIPPAGMIARDWPFNDSGALTPG